MGVLLLIDEYNDGRSLGSKHRIADHAPHQTAQTIEDFSQRLLSLRRFSPSAPTCHEEKPVSAPDLFQINPQAHSVTLFFSPASGKQDRYVVSYGTTAGVEQYGLEINNHAQGVIQVEIQALQANTAYFFRVRAGNGCQPGDWSNELAAKTG